jgi:hypothetical protein
MGKGSFPVTIPDKPPAEIETEGNDVRDWMATLRQALFDSVTEADVADIAKGLVDRAKNGDLQATRLLFSYVIGSPTTRINVKNAVITPGTPEPTKARG